jgi:hypothetical protein
VLSGGENLKKDSSTASYGRYVHLTPVTGWIWVSYYPKIEPDPHLIKYQKSMIILFFDLFFAGCRMLVLT